MIQTTRATEKTKKIPPYEQLYLQLLERIKGGELVERIPSINELAEDSSVSIATVKKAIDKLKNQKILYGQKGKAIFVNPEAFRQPLFQRHVVIFIQENIYRNSFYLRVINDLRNRLEEDQSVVHFVNSIPQLANTPQVDILVVMDMGTQKQIAAIQALIPPERTIYLHCLSNQIYNVGTDNFLGGQIAVNALYQAGHRHIGIISRDVDYKHSFFYQRYRGVTTYAKDHPDLFLYNHSLSPRDGYSDERDGCQIAGLLLKEHPEITAIFAFTDILALGVYNYCNRNSLHIPEDISVIGFDDKEFSPLLVPGLTTIREDSEAISNAIARIMRGIAKGSAAPCQLQCPPALIQRDSIVPPQKRAANPDNL